MDELYDYLWDVTLLEYIVSMHAKRGEFSRKRRALDIITQVSKQSKGKFFLIAGQMSAQIMNYPSERPLDCCRAQSKGR